ncbi:RNA dependent RNA polymerase-domain-containing protein [Glomus cerebriforme]|uniref:RNA-dependent RNA polymerase n=1 Tax=Glomus cerebriforme TaxID=658196 RepID=A0A397SR92_9GLOM|nr:RNA dependent RNA polymerase-domain-containing protein [Glomus cerebriforme]
MNINSSISSINSLNEPGDSHKVVLPYIRRLQKFTMNDIPGCNELFVTSDQRICMNEIAKVDSNLLDKTVRQFIVNNKLNENETLKNISQLREIFMEELTKVYVNLPGDNNDEEWEYSLNQSDESSSLPSSSKSSIIFSSTIENPWITQYRSTTKMPEEYEQYVEGIAFLDRYEIVRILKPFGPIEPTNRLWNQIKIKFGVDIHEILYEACEEHFSKLSNVNNFVEMKKIINRNLANIWHLSLKKFPNTGSRVHILFSGEVLFKDNQLILTLNPPKIGHSKRYYRLLSSERFLHLKIKNTDSLDDNQKLKLKSLLLFPLSLAGRTYEFLYAKSNILYYFATSGPDISDNMSIWQVINYNLPIELNKNMTTAKFYSRISLGFSNTTPTIVFKPKEILYTDDITINGHCFTDGCAAISLAAMKEVAEILGCKETPSAIQGRIGGAKGVWYIDPRRDFSENKWIELRESQIKYKLNLNDDDYIHLRTLEVLHVVVPPTKPGALNSQLIRVLYNGGVSLNVFLEMMKEYAEKIKSEVIGCDNPRSLISWVTNNSNIMRNRLEIFYNHYFENDSSDDENNNFDLYIDLELESYTMSGFPDNPSEQCIQMLQAGFTPSTCPYLAKNLKNVLSSTLKSLFTKFRINIPLSRMLICIADPTKTLKPGEVFIQLDREAGRDERTGLPFGIIEDEVILARNPCGLPSDIVKVRAVKNMDLSIYYNVVIFPVNVAKKGDASLATNLSGGDYDGDKIFCCWDPQIVKAYKNSPILSLDPRIKNAFDKNNQTLNELLSSVNSNQMDSVIQEIILDIYFKDLETPHGLYDRWHKLQSSEYGIFDKQSIYLAQMNAQLIDATKRGLIIKPNVQQNDYEIFRKLPVPYWMEKEDNYKIRSKSKQVSNGVNFGVKGIMDSLCIEIENEMSEIINNKGLLVAEMNVEPDSHIYNFWYDEVARAQKMEEDSLYLDDLNLISTYISQLVQNYNSKYAQILGNQNREENEQSLPSCSSKQSTFYNINAPNENEECKSVDYEFLKKFLNTPPVEKYKSKTFKFLKDRRSTIFESRLDPLTIFELKLKAASLYLSSVGEKPDKQICWAIAFRTLCNIKSQMLENERHLVVGGPRSVIDEVWQALRIDEKWLKRKKVFQ